MGLKERNNPLGQRAPSSDRVGGSAPRLKHDQSAELVEGIKEKAAKLSKESAKKKPKPAAESKDYDTAGPDRQPGKVMRQDRLGKEPRKTQDGQYTQDNEEESDPV